MTSKNKRLHFTGRNALQEPFLPKIHPSFPKFLLTCLKITEMKHDFEKTERSTTSLSFCLPFLKNERTDTTVFAKAGTYFAKISSPFAPCLGNFARIITNSKHLGVPLHPLHPRLLQRWLQIHQCTAT